MTLSDIYTMLNGITQFADKVAYRAFPVGNAPQMPYICYLSTNSNNFFADNKVAQKAESVDIELYTDTKDIASEELVEEKLNANNLPWEKTETYIDSEQCYQITYTIEVRA